VRLNFFRQTFRRREKAIVNAGFYNFKNIAYNLALVMLWMSCLYDNKVAEKTTSGIE
jgi:hypothetical protein